MGKDLDKQIYIYSLDTSAFYTDEEFKIHEKLQYLYLVRDALKGVITEKRDNKENGKSFGLDNLEILSADLKVISKEINALKEKLNKKLNGNQSIRTLRNEYLSTRNVISIFDSVLTRTLKLEEDDLTTDILVVQSYYYKVLEDLITYGFYHEKEKYIYYTSSAGQIRTKKCVFIKESLWVKHQNSLTCGLSVEEINAKGGSNVNKFQSYLALSNSATIEWKRFNIDKCIVVPDLETQFPSEVDYINYETYEIKREITDVSIEHTDGCGMILPSKYSKSFMCRLPFIKGLLVPFDFKKFAEENESYIVKDIYDKEWNILEDNIEIIFTKSQFKMHKYYDDWDDYKKRFKKYQCQAAKLNIEDTSNDATLNYQMLQTLTDIKDEELESLAQLTNKELELLGSDKKVMLNALGATSKNNYKNYFQTALLMYPNLLNDEHAKQTIKNKKKSMITEAKAGKLKTSGKYTFICPDLYAFCEFLFLKIKSPNGLLKQGEVFCRIFKEGKLDCLRSPHLYREHAIRNNVSNKELSKWFISDGIYTSVKDTISKMLQFDNDGDKALVIQDEILVEVAERNMKGIVPLYYEMKKADAEEINSENIFKSLSSAYKANIGEISNNITKIWNNPDPNLRVIKWLCMENNFTIDYAKTLYMPERPPHVDKEINKYIKNNLPYFFKYAKKKDEKNLSPINDSVVNRLEKTIDNKRLMFSRVAKQFDYKNLMRDSSVEVDKKIIDKYIELDRSKKWLKYNGEIKTKDRLYIYKVIRNKLLEIHNDIDYIVDTLVKHLYSKNSSKYKTTLWETFGDILVRNLEMNLKGMKPCEDCGTPFLREKAKKYCESCSKKRRYESVKKFRKNNEIK